MAPVGALTTFSLTQADLPHEVGADGCLPLVWGRGVRCCPSSVGGIRNPAAGTFASLGGTAKHATQSASKVPSRLRERKRERSPPIAAPDFRFHRGREKRRARREGRQSRAARRRFASARREVRSDSCSAPHPADLPQATAPRLPAHTSMPRVVRFSP